MPQDITPEQIALLESYGNNLLSSPDMTNVRHPLQAFAAAFNALSGRQHVNLAERHRARQRKEFTSRSVVPRPGITTGSVEPESTTPKPDQPTLGPQQTQLLNPDGRRLRSIRAGRSGAEFTVADEYADRFQQLFDRLEESGYNIDPQQSSGYNYRNIRNSNRLSQHAHGNAVDINSRLNARGRRGNIDDALARRLETELGLRWGGRFPFRDDMHWEIDPNWRAPTPAAASPGGVTGPPTTIGGPPNDGRMGLGMGAQAAQALQSQAGEQSLVTQAQSPDQGSPNQNNISRNRPPGSPERIPPDLNIQRIERLLEMGANLNPKQIEDLTTQYQTLIQPKPVETPGGTSYYDPFSGRFMFFAPKLQTPSIGVGDINVTDPYFIGPQGATSVPRTGTSNQQPGADQAQPFGVPGGAGAIGSPPNPAAGGAAPTRAQASSQLPPYVQEILNQPSPATTLNLPEFPVSRDPGDLARFGTELNSQRSSIAKTTEAGATSVNGARDRANNAGRALESLNTIRSAALSAPNLIRGQGLSDFVQKWAVYFRNLGINIPSNIPQGEIIQKLNADLAARVVEDITNRGTNFQLDTFMRNFPSLGQSFEGSLALMDYLIQVQQHHQQLGQIANQVGAGQGHRWNEIETAFHNNNPIYLNIPGPDGRTAARIYTGTIRNAQDAFSKVKDGERFITPDGRMGIMTPELRAKFQGGR